MCKTKRARLRAAGFAAGGTRETSLTVKVSQIGLGIFLSAGSFDVAPAPPEREAAAEATKDAKTVTREFVAKVFISSPSRNLRSVFPNMPRTTAE